MAEYILKNKTKDIYCESRATSSEEIGNDIYPPAKRCLDKHNIKLTNEEKIKILKNEIVKMLPILQKLFWKNYQAKVQTFQLYVFLFLFGTDYSWKKHLIF